MIMFRSHKDYSFKKRSTHIHDENFSSDEMDCEFCSDSEKYFSETELMGHKRSSHYSLIKSLVEEDSLYYCQICIKKFLDRDKLIRHTKTDHLLSSEDTICVEREIFICSKCSQIFFNKDLLSLHIEVTHTFKKIGNHLVKCLKCPKRIKCLNIWHHFQLHRILSMTCCPICLVKLPDNHRLRSHIEEHTHHYTCEMCKYETKNAEFFKKHLEKHDLKDVEDKTVEESWRYVAPKKRKWKYYPNIGLRGISMLNGLYICILCRFICDGEEEIAKHVWQHKTRMQNEVKSSKIYICTCGSAFLSGILLKHHVFKLKGDHQEALIRDQVWM